jgi:hypothetical protein
LFWEKEVRVQRYRTRKRALQGLLADPFDSRPAGEKADELGIGEEKLRRWSEDLEFWGEVYVRLRTRLEAMLPRVLGAVLSKSIDTGDVPAAKLLLQLAGKLSDDAGAKAGSETYKEILLSCLKERGA